MTTVSYSDLRKHLADFLTIVEDDREEIVVHRSKGRQAVIVALDEYQSLKETAYLLSSKKNREHLGKSLREARNGKTVRITV